MVQTRSAKKKANSNGIPDALNDILQVKKAALNSRGTRKANKPKASKPKAVAVNANVKVRQEFSKVKAEIKKIIPSNVNDKKIDDLIIKLTKIKTVQDNSPQQIQQNTTVAKRPPFKSSEKLKPSTKKRKKLDFMDDFGSDSPYNSTFKPANPFESQTGQQVDKPISPQDEDPFLQAIQKRAKTLKKISPPANKPPVKKSKSPPAVKPRDPFLAGIQNMKLKPVNTSSNKRKKSPELPSSLANAVKDAMDARRKFLKRDSDGTSNSKFSS